MAEKINVPGMVRLPAFCHATRAGDFVFVSGTLGTTDEKGTLAEGGTGPETAQTLRNIERILSEAGADLGDLVKLNVYLADMGTFREMNAAYVEALGEGPAARITVGGAELALGAAVEIDAVAFAPRS